MFVVKTSERRQGVVTPTPGREGPTEHGDGTGSRDRLGRPKGNTREGLESRMVGVVGRFRGEGLTESSLRRRRVSEHPEETGVNGSRSLEEKRT